MRMLHFTPLKDSASSLRFAPPPARGQGMPMIPSVWHPRPNKILSTLDRTQSGPHGFVPRLEPSYSLKDLLLV
ncbi:hypothetical protein JCGZ_17142 [Jatropha curcas]|uniref:Uncharacterized protein n=1 Tax=Jatropha curcas TaxID=180498 RepID=A0A067KE18_JATCU|nr:hypothetical protein JCGZ_17142 [Jatropha curcas]